MTHEIMDFIEDITNHSVRDRRYFSDDEVPFIIKHDQLDDLVAQSSVWHKAGEGGVDRHDGRAYAYFKNAQVAKGKQRKDILIIDYGGYRVVYIGSGE